MEKNPLSFQLKLNPDDFLPATDEEKESLVVMRDSVSFWKDGFRRLRKNKVAMVCLFIIIIVMIFAFIHTVTNSRFRVRITLHRCIILPKRWSK